MARGWESKSIEAQQEESSRGQEGMGRHAMPEDRARQQRLRTLELARARAAADLERATTPAHRAMLEESIAHLDELLKTL
jgi:hypothetical protein